MTAAPARPERSGLVPEPMLPRPFRVESRSAETADTATLEFAPVEGDAISFQPGQFTMLYVYGVGEVPISIAGGSPDGRTLLQTVRAVGAVTDAVCRLEPGDIVGIRGPYGTGWPISRAAGRDVVVIAGGIGLAPLRTLVLHVFSQREDFGAVSLLYGARSPSDLLYEAELHEWRGRFDIEVEVTVDRSAEGWHGDVGVVTTLLPRIEFDSARTTAMVCGPEVMMKVVARELVAAGVPSEDVHLSMERNMKCAIGFCGHCQFGPGFVCRDGPVMSYASIADRLRIPGS